MQPILDLFSTEIEEAPVVTVVETPARLALLARRRSGDLKGYNSRDKGEYEAVAAFLRDPWPAAKPGSARR